MAVAKNLTTQFVRGDLDSSDLNKLLTGLRGHIGGLQISNDAGDTAHDILTSVGPAIDSTGLHLLVLADPLIKSILSIWAPGTTAGGLFSGTVSANTWYHYFLIAKPDGTIDVGFDTSVIAANIPTDYTLFRRIGSLRTDGSSNIIGFSQLGDEFLLNTPRLGFSQGNPGTGAVTQALDAGGAVTFVPTGIQVHAILSVSLEDSSPAAGTFGIITSLDQADVAPTASLSDLRLDDGSPQHDSTRLTIRTNTSAQIRTRISNSDAGVGVKGTVHGWIDLRGKAA